MELTLLWTFNLLLQEGNYVFDCLLQQKYPANAIILSAQFWPPFKEESKLDLPDVAKEQFDIYTKAFETLKVCFISVL